MLTEADKAALKQSLIVAIWTFVVLFVTQVLGWLADLNDWLSEDAQAPFPETSALVQGLASAIIAAFVFVGASLLAVGQAHLKHTEPPAVEDPQVGSPE